MATDFDDLNKNEQSGKRQNTKDTRTNTKAQRDNTKALVEQVDALKKQLDAVIKVSQAQNKQISALKKKAKAQSNANKKTILSTKYQRNLAGSLSVLRSELLITAFVFNSLRKTVGATFVAFAEYENAQKRVEQTIKSTGGAAGLQKEEVISMAQSYESLTGISETLITQSSALLLTFTNIGGDVFPKTQKAILDMTAAMNNGKVTMEGLKSSTIQVGKALNNPIKGITALSRVGVKFTNQQKTQIKLLMLTGDLMGAQKIILAELNKEFGGISENEDFAKTLRVFSTELGNLSKDIGEKLTPGLESIVENLTTLVKWLNPKDIFMFSGAIVTSTLSLTLLNTQLKIIQKYPITGIARIRVGIRNIGSNAAKSAAKVGLLNTSIKMLSSTSGLLMVGGIIAGVTTYLAHSKDEAEETTEALGKVTQDINLLGTDVSKLKDNELQEFLNRLNKKLDEFATQSKINTDNTTDYGHAIGILTSKNNLYSESQQKNFDNLGLVNEETQKAIKINGMLGAYNTINNKETLKAINLQYDLGLNTEAWTFNLNKVIKALEKKNKSTQHGNKINEEELEKYKKQREATLQRLKETESISDAVGKLTEVQNDLIASMKLKQQQSMFAIDINGQLRQSMKDEDQAAHESMLTTREYTKILKQMGIVFPGVEGGIGTLEEALVGLDPTLQKAIKDMVKTLGEEKLQEEEVRIEQEKLDKLKTMYSEFAEEMLELTYEYNQGKIDADREYNQRLYSDRLKEINDSKKHEKFKKRERDKALTQQRAAEIKSHNEEIDLKKKKVWVDLAMSIGRIWSSYAAMVGSNFAKWAPIFGGPAIAAAESSANLAVMLTQIGIATTTAAVQAGNLDKQKMARGGLLGGQSHAMGGTIIEAEKGEFVVRKQAVEKYGADFLSGINREQFGVDSVGDPDIMGYKRGGMINKNYYRDGGMVRDKANSSNISVVINNPILSKDIVEEELIPQIKEAIRRGADIGIE